MRVLLVLCLMACSRPHGEHAGGDSLDAATARDGALATDADPDACAAGVAIGTPCTTAGATCTAHCTACSAGLFTTDPDALICQADPAAPGTLRWTTFDEIDCFPRPGECTGVFTDAACTAPLDCPACGTGAVCTSPSDCCDGTTCVGGMCGRAPTCHVDDEPCSDGIACCGGQACGTDGRCPPDSCQPAGGACWRGAECCFDTGGCDSDTDGHCLPGELR